MADIRKKVARKARQYERALKVGYYLENPNREDMGIEFCPKCVRTVIKEEKQKGKVWVKYQLDPSSDHDTRCYCHRCGRGLHGRYTDYAVESELDHFEEYGFDIESPSDCHSWELCEGSTVEGTDEYRRLLALVGLVEEVPSRE